VSILTDLSRPEPKGTPVERNRLSSSDYRKKNPEKAKTSARLSNFRARARKKGFTSEKDIEEKVSMWEKEWQEKQAKEASEVSILFIYLFICFICPAYPLIYPIAGSCLLTLYPPIVLFRNLAVRVRVGVNRVRLTGFLSPLFPVHLRPSHFIRLFLLFQFSLSIA